MVLAATSVESLCRLKTKLLFSTTVSKVTNAIPKRNSSEKVKEHQLPGRQCISRPPVAFLPHQKENQTRLTGTKVIISQPQKLRSIRLWLKNMHQNGTLATGAKDWTCVTSSEHFEPHPYVSLCQKPLPPALASKDTRRISFGCFDPPRPGVSTRKPGRQRVNKTGGRGKTTPGQRQKPVRTGETHKKCRLTRRLAAASIQRGVYLHVRVGT